MVNSEHKLEYLEPNILFLTDVLKISKEDVCKELKMFYDEYVLNDIDEDYEPWLYKAISSKYNIKKPKLCLCYHATRLFDPKIIFKEGLKSSYVTKSYLCKQLHKLEPHIDNDLWYSIFEKGWNHYLLKHSIENGEHKVHAFRCLEYCLLGNEENDYLATTERCADIFEIIEKFFPDIKEKYINSTNPCIVVFSHNYSDRHLSKILSYTSKRLSGRKPYDPGCVDDDIEVSPNRIKEIIMCSKSSDIDYLSYKTEKIIKNESFNQEQY